MKTKRCNDFCPPGFRGHWRDWHRGGGCSLDDGLPRNPQGAAEIVALGVDHKPYAVLIVVMRDSRVLLCQGPQRAACEICGHSDCRPSEGTCARALDQCECAEILGARPGWAAGRTWCLPGGKVERGEDAAQAAFREGLEELDVLVRLRGGEDGPEPFYKGHTHDGRTMWAYLGKVPEGTPDAWDAPEGRCEFIEELATPSLYRPEWLPAYCRVMRALPASSPRSRSAYLLHLEECASCQKDPARPCETGGGLYASAVEGVDDECE